MPRTARILDVLTKISALLLGATLGLMFLGYTGSPAKHHIALGSNFRVGVHSQGLDCHVVFFNSEKGPIYDGMKQISLSLLAFEDRRYNPPVLPQIQFTNSWGITLTDCRWPNGSVDWAWTFSLWYPAVLFSILPTVRFVRKVKDRKHSRQQTPAESTFSLQGIFIATTIIAIAAGMQLFLHNRSCTPAQKYWLWFGSGALVGGAVFGLARRPIMGTLIGLFFQAVLLFLIQSFFHERL